MKYKIIIIILFIFSGLLAKAQDIITNLPRYDYKKYSFGFTIGINTYDFAIQPIDNYHLLDSIQTLESNGHNGFNIAILSTLKLGKNLDLRFIPGLSFGGRDLEYRLKVNDSLIYTEYKSIESTLFEFPFSLKYKSNRYKNSRAYVLGGFKYSIDLASKEDKEDVREKLIKLKRHDIAYELGFGMDFYFEFFKLSPEIKFSMGLNDLLVRENDVYTNSVQSMKSKVLLISFIIQ